MYTGYQLRWTSNVSGYLRQKLMLLFYLKYDLTNPLKATKPIKQTIPKCTHCLVILKPKVTCVTSLIRLSWKTLLSDTIIPYCHNNHCDIATARDKNIPKSKISFIFKRETTFFPEQGFASCFILTREMSNQKFMIMVYIWIGIFPSENTESRDRAILG